MFLIGTPKQYSDSVVEVVVVGESLHPPVIVEPKVFFVIVSKPYVVTNIGQVRVQDRDHSDIHQYQITNGNHNNVFSIQVFMFSPFCFHWKLSIGIVSTRRH